MIAVVAVAYGTQAPQLGVAEFAPAARQSVDPPPTTSGPDVATGGRGAGRRSTTTTAPGATGSSSATSGAGAAPTTVVGRARQCFGSPPRQLPDPRSPACAAVVFEGDNGGATSAGVSGTEVRVSIQGASETDRVALSALFEYVNRSFEFYGRRLVPVFLETGAIGTVTDQRAMAVDVAANGVFASLGAMSGYWFPVFYNELARQGVVSVMSGSYELASDRDLLDQSHPYVWSVYPSAEQTLRSLANLTCTALAGRNAIHAGGELVDKRRRFGVVVSGNYRLPWARPLLDGLAECDESPMVVELLNTGDASWSTTARTALQRLKADGMTTLICVCSENRALSVAGQASAAAIEDVEWMLPSFVNYQWEEYYLQTSWPAGLRQRVFGLQPFAKTAPAQMEWWLNAAREINPAVVADGGYLLRMYERLLVLAAGIQGAGPGLSAAAFGAGLMATSFPNSEAAREPYWLPSIGFGPGDHSFYSDYALAWWNANADALGPLANPKGGSWCYLDRGARYAAGRFPADADSRFFNPNEPCR